MGSLEELFGAAQMATSSHSIEEVVIALLLAFLLSQCAAWIYVYTHAGLSYSRAFVQSIILLSLIVCMGMMVIGNNIVVAFGLIGAFAIVRFRNVLKDTRDTAFIFFSLVIGMATGTGCLLLSAVGSFLFCAVVLYLHWSFFGNRDTGDGFLRCCLDTNTGDQEDLNHLISRFCLQSRIVSQRFEESGRNEMSYRLMMRNPTKANAFVNELNALAGIQNVAFVLHEEEAEV